MKKELKIAKLLLLSLFIFSCSGEDGDVGPAGPAGSQGEQGPQGDQGAQGDQGDPGTANVVYSDWFERDFIVAGAAESNIMGLSVLSENELNPDTDLVLVYGRRTSGGNDTNGVYVLPYILYSQDEHYGFGFFDATGGTSIQVRVNTTDGGTNLFTFFDDFRYIVVPGGQVASKGESAIDYQSMPYAEIIKIFNIEE